MKPEFKHNLKVVIYVVAIITAAIIINEVLHAKLDAPKHNDLTPEVKI